MKTVKELTAELNEARAINKEIFNTYYKMEGKYATKVVYTDCAMHDRGYDFEYATPEDKEKEKAEREAILKNLIDETAIEKEIVELKNKTFYEKHGMTREEYNTRHAIQQYKKEIAELEKQIASLEEWLAELKNKKV